MRSVITILLLGIMGLTFMTGCAAMIASNPTGTGFLYTDISGPVTATSNTGYSKMGTASFTSILGIICTGDASIDTAMRNGGITKIHHVDFKANNILGIIATYKVIVYGE